MLIFGRLEGEKNRFFGCNFLTEDKKIVPIARNDFRIAHHLFCLFMLLHMN